jgi:hypothetical protein
MKKTKLPICEMSSGNIFADLGLPNAEELPLKAQIASEIRDVVKRRNESKQNYSSCPNNSAAPDKP